MRKQGYTGPASTNKADRGFYVILAVCLLVIGVSSYVLFFSQGNQPEAQEQIYLPSTESVTQAPVSVPDVDVPAEPAIQPEPVEPVTEQEEPPAELPEPAEPEVEKEETAAPAPIWVKPVDGEVLKHFSGDTLVKDETMGDWRVHTGTDYAAEIGTRVYAVSDGTVTRADMDPLYGGVVVLELADGKQAVYHGLAEQLKVATDDQVRAGDVIGTVGTMGSESGQDSHLHIEVYADGQTIDPESVFGVADSAMAEQEEPAVDASQPQDSIDVEE